MYRVDQLADFWGVPEKCLKDEFSRRGVEIGQDDRGRATVPDVPPVLRAVDEQVRKGLA